MALELKIDDMKPLNQQRLLDQQTIRSLKSSMNQSKSSTCKQNSLNSSIFLENANDSNRIAISQNDLHNPSTRYVSETQQNMQTTVNAQISEFEWLRYVDIFPLATPTHIIALRIMIIIASLFFSISYLLTIFTFNHHPTVYIYCALMIAIGVFVFLCQVKINCCVRIVYYEIGFVLNSSQISCTLFILLLVQPLSFGNPLNIAAASLCIISLIGFGIIIVWFCVQWLRIVFRKLHGNSFIQNQTGIR